MAPGLFDQRPEISNGWEKAKSWLADGTVNGGMGPKLRSCHHALLAGVCEVHIGQTRVRL